MRVFLPGTYLKPETGRDGTRTAFAREIPSEQSLQLFETERFIIARFSVALKLLNETAAAPNVGLPTLQLPLDSPATPTFLRLAHPSACLSERATKRPLISSFSSLRLKGPRGMKEKKAFAPKAILGNKKQKQRTKSPSRRSTCGLWRRAVGKGFWLEITIIIMTVFSNRATQTTRESALDPAASSRRFSRYFPRSPFPH